MTSLFKVYILMNMKSTRKSGVNTLVFSLIALTVLIVGIRILVTDPSRFPPGDSLWKLTLNVEVENNDQNTRIFVPTPHETALIRIVKQSFFSPTMILTKVKQKKGDYRTLIYNLNNKGFSKLQLEYLIRVIGSLKGSSFHKKSDSNPDVLQQYLAADLPVSPEEPWIKNTLIEINKNSPNKLAFITNVVKTIHSLSASPIKEKQSDLSAFDRAILAVVLCRANQLPARVITGVKLKEELEAPLYNWIEVFYENKWHSFDPTYGFTTLPRNYLSLKVGHRAYIESSGDQSIKYSIDISEEHDTSGLVTPSGQSKWRILDLTRFSKDLQDDISKLFLLPFAILLTAFIHLLLGVRFYGTFTPTMVALSLTYIHWLTAVILFLIVILFTIIGRFNMPKSMSKVPRLSIVFTLVALGLGFGLSFMEFASLADLSQKVLLPVVILSTLIDRLYTTWETDGKRATLVRLFWTFVISTLCIPIVSNQWAAFWVLRYPEVHLLTIAAILLLFKYEGPKLIKHIRLPWLFEEEKKKKKK